jgi:predicted P-loop ATPase
MDVESVESSGEFVPNVTFEKAELTEDRTTRNNKFVRVKLIEQGVHIGWLGKDSDGWCIISDQPTLIQPYLWSDGKTYYRDQGGYWLSIKEKNDSHEVGFYSRWASAIPWWLEGNRFFSYYTTFGGKRPELSKWRNQINKRLYLTVEDPKFLITLDVKFEEQ